MITQMASCLAKAVAANILDQKSADQLLTQAKSKAARYARSVPADEAERLAVEKVMQEEKAAKELAKRQKQITVIKASEIGDAMKAHPSGEYRSAISHLTHDVTGKHRGANVEYKTESIVKIARNIMRDAIEVYRPKGFGFKQDKVGLRSFVRELMDGNTGDATAKAAAKAWTETHEYLFERHTKAGGGIPERKDWILPQPHNSDRVRKAGFDEWFSVFGEKTKQKMMSVNEIDESAYKTMMRGIYGQISTDGIQGLRVTESMGPGRAKVANARTDARSILFGSADEWLAYNDRFGAGDIFQSLNTHIHEMARDIAMMEVLGPNPDAMMRGMQVLIKKAKEDNPHIAARQARRFEKTYDVVSGKLNVPENVIIARSAGGVRNLLSAAQLGRAILSSATDFAFARAVSLWNGLETTSVMKRYLSLMNPADPSQRILARRAGMIMDNYIGETAAARRFSDEIIGTGWTGWLASQTFKLSGLDAHTNAIKNSFRLEMLGVLADESEKAFAQLPDKIQGTLMRGGFDEAAWDALRKFDLIDADGVKFMDPAGAAVRGTPEQQAAGQRLHEYILAEGSYMAPEPDAFVRSYTRGQRGAASGELWNSFTQYKGFGVTTLMLNARRAWHEAGGSLTGTGMLAGGTAIASQIGSATVLGALALQLIAVSKGKNPLDMATPEFWAEAAIQGGGFGIMGDFLRSALDRNYKQLVTTLSGPSLGLLDDIIKLSSNQARRAADGNDTKFAFELINFIQRYAPGGSLFYLQTAMDRMVFSQARDLADRSGSMQRNRNMIARARKDYNQEFFWRPGEATPDRAPDFGAMLGR